MIDRKEFLELKDMVAEIYAILTASQPGRLDGVNMPAFKAAIRATVRGDRQALARYMKRGGKIPLDEPKTDV